MGNDIVTLSQYDNVATFGLNSMRELEDLNKALQAGYDNPPATGGGALRVESLEQSLKILTYQAKHCVMWQKIPKAPAFSTVEEFNQLRSVGNDQGAFVFEGELPASNDSDYNRAVQLVKFLGTTRTVTHPMTLVRTSIGDVIAQENTNGILWILKNLEWAFFNGNADMCYCGLATDSTHREGPEFNGLAQQIDSSMVVDMYGAPLTTKTLSDAAQMVASNYGIATDAFLSFGAIEDLSNSLIGPAQRILLPNAAQDGFTFGGSVKDISTPFGNINLNPDVFLNPGISPPTIISTNVVGLVPSSPASVTSAMGAAGTGNWTEYAPSNGNMAYGGDGTYTYQVTACNRWGESLPTTISAPVVISGSNDTEAVILSITNGGGNNPPEYFKIYKSQPGGTGVYLVARVQAANQSSAGVTTFTDDGSILAGTSTAYVGQLDMQVLAAKQLAPLMKMDLAVIAPSVRWMILCYITMLVYAPKKWVVIKNIGRPSGSDIPTQGVN